MSLIDKKNKKELQDIARSLLIELDPSLSVPEMRMELKKEKVTDDDIEGLEIAPEVDENAPVVNTAAEGILTTNDLLNKDESDEVKEPVLHDKPVEADDDDNVLLRYERQNNTFQIMTYQFSREHPFSLVSAKDADYIVRNIPGFRPAVQSEVKEYYG